MVKREDSWFVATLKDLSDSGRELYPLINDNDNLRMRQSNYHSIQFSVPGLKFDISKFWPFNDRDESDFGRTQHRKSF